MSPFCALPGLAKVYFYMIFCFSVFAKWFFLKIQLFCKKVEFSQKKIRKSPKSWLWVRHLSKLVFGALFSWISWILVSFTNFHWKPLFSQKVHFFVIIENFSRFQCSTETGAGWGRKTLTPSQGFGLGRGNGGISPNFTENGDFREISGNCANLVKFVKN